MCEILGFTSAKATDITDQLRSFYAHSVRHPHGWGMMRETTHGTEIIHEATRALDSENLASLTEQLDPQKIFLGHIRFATVGSIKLENCHPFSGKDISGRQWTMIHNGTIYSSKNMYRFYANQTGDTDSERIFMLLIETLNSRLSHGKMTERDRFETVNRFIIDNSARNKLNLIIYDGELMYVHKNLKNTLSYRRIGSGIMFATTPVDDGDWAPFPMAQVIAYRGGKQVYRGDRHKGEFIPTLDYITALDAMNI